MVAVSDRFAREGLTFDDVTLIPSRSSVLPSEVSTGTKVTPDIALAIPIMSAAMDTVTEARLAIAMAREGGLGILHRNLSIEDQAREVDTSVGCGAAIERIFGAGHGADYAAAVDAEDALGI